MEKSERYVQNEKGVYRHMWWYVWTTGCWFCTSPDIAISPSLPTHSIPLFVLHVDFYQSINIIICFESIIFYRGIAIKAWRRRRRRKRWKFACSCVVQLQTQSRVCTLFPCCSFPFRSWWINRLYVNESARQEKERAHRTLALAHSNWFLLNVAQVATQSSCVIDVIAY